MFSFICARKKNSWVNNGEAGHFGHNRAHYDVTTMLAEKERVDKCRALKNEHISLCQWSLFMCVFWHYWTFEFDDVGNYFRFYQCYQTPNFRRVKIFYVSLSLIYGEEFSHHTVYISHLYTDDIYKYIICDWFVRSSNLVIANGDLLTTPSVRCLRVNVSCHSYICEVIQLAAPLTYKHFEFLLITDYICILNKILLQFLLKCRIVNKSVHIRSVLPTCNNDSSLGTWGDFLILYIKWCNASVQNLSVLARVSFWLSDS